MNRLGVVVLWAVVAGAQAPKFGHCASSEQLRHYETVAGPQLSPDGAQVVFVTRAATTDGAASHLWLAETAGTGAARQITFSAPSDHTGESAPQWMPDGSAILFLGKRGDVRQVFRLPTGGGEAAAVQIEIPGAAKPLALSIESFAISPDGGWLAVRARQPLTAAESQAVKAKKDAKVVNEDRHPARVWLYSFASGKTLAVTAADRQANAVAWSPDSRRLAVITAPPGNADDLGPRHRLEVVAIADLSHPRRLAGAPATVGSVVFSPSGQELALTAQSAHDTPPGIAAVFLMPAAGGAVRDLSDGDDLDLAGRSVVWSRDGSALYVGAQRGTRSGLAKIAVADGKAEWRPMPSAVAAEFATNLRQSGWVYVAQSSDQMPQIAFRRRLWWARAPARLRRASRLGPGPSRLLSHANPDWATAGWTAATAVSWPGTGGLTIHGLYFAPRAGCAGEAAVVGGKTPLILMVHGGPTGAFLETYSPFVQWLTAQGWAVLEPNPRGSTGYGWRFAAANKNDLGDKDFDDVMAGVDWALAHRPVDARRLGLYGYSYGGEMAGFAEGKTDRFAAIVAGAPVIDQYSEYGTEDGSWYDRWFFGRPWLRPQDAWRQSPLAYAGKAHTPLLLLQGQADITDPLGQSEEMYRALRQEGVAVRLVTFPREVHGTLAGGIAGAPSIEPWHGLEAREEILEWFRSHFQKRGVGR
ncbi:MAG TPA: S9 family peptidase [Terriglobales bacterium]|nr:S9 family peptidase [Terriglobales bacterium]